MKNKMLLLTLLFVCIVTPVSAQWCGVQTLFFQHANAPDIPGYEQLINYPSGAPEVDESVTIQASSGPVLIDTYLSPVGTPDVSEITNGLRRYRTFMYVNSASGITRLNFTPFIRYTNGTERNVYTVMSDDIESLTVSEYLTSYTNPNNTYMEASARYGIRVTANTTHPSPIVVHWVYEGTLHYSSVDSGNFVCGDYSSMPISYYVPKQSPSNAFAPMIATGIIGFLLLRKRE